VIRHGTECAPVLSHEGSIIIIIIIIIIIMIMFIMSIRTTIQHKHTQLYPPLPLILPSPPEWTSVVTTTTGKARESHSSFAKKSPEGKGEKQLVVMVFLFNFREIQPGYTQTSTFLILAIQSFTV